MSLINASGGLGNLLLYPSAASDSDADADAFIAKLSGSYTAGEESAINDFFVDLKNANIYSKIDFLYIHALKTEADALLDIKGDFDATILGGVTHTAGVGVSIVTAGYIDTGYNPATPSGNFGTSNNGTMGVYSNTSDNATADKHEMGSSSAGDSTNSTMIACRRAGDFRAKVGSSAASVQTANTDGSGFYTVGRSGTTVFLYKNGSLATSATQTFSSFYNGNLYVLALNRNGTAAYFSTRSLAISFAAGYLDATENSALNTAVTALLTAL